ncbi:MAG: hypothetical protein HYY26_05150 [Acidobacteria bacterium]|nr:hypothetical protein [Acidobacteriota bacterium]
MTFDDVWAAICRHAGERFFRLAGRPFSYAVEQNSLKPSTWDQSIPRTDFERALASGHLHDLRKLKEEFGIEAHTYLHAILTDPRIKKD